jgi:hypothetical protein
MATMTRLSRRSASAPPASTATTTATVTAAAVGAGPDAELLGLGKQFDELAWQYRLVEEKNRLRSERYEDLIEAQRRQGHTPEQWEDVLDRIGKQLDEEFGPAIKPDALDILNMLDAPLRRILAFPTATLAGLAVKARVARFGCEDFWDTPAEDLDFDQRMVRELIDAVLDFCNRAARSEPAKSS